jgi:hypothetical protein
MDFRFHQIIDFVAEPLPGKTTKSKGLNPLNLFPVLAAS